MPDVYSPNPSHAGRLRHRVTLRTAGVTRDEYGEEVPAPVAVGTYWANVRPVTGRESQIAGQISADVDLAVELRGRIAVDATQDFLFRGRVLGIVSVVDPRERGLEQVILCKEARTPTP
jgi:SPP1 family predicted phage head-tail adaptor